MRVCTRDERREFNGVVYTVDRKLQSEMGRVCEEKETAAAAEYSGNFLVNETSCAVVHRVPGVYTVSAIH